MMMMPPNKQWRRCNGRDLMGRALVVNEARPPKKREWASSGHPGRGQRAFGGSKNRW
jgi:hypothetical protein